MKFSVDKSSLLNGIQTVQNAVTQKSSLPILSNVLLEVNGTELNLTATDLDMGICSRIAVQSEEDGAVTVPAKKFFDIIKSLPDGQDISIQLKKNNSVNISGGKAQFKIIGLPKEDFPRLPVFEEKESIVLEKEKLKEIINLADFACSRDDSRHVLTGLLFEVKGEDVNVVATDGRRLAVVKNKIGKKTLIDRKVIISIKTIQEVKRLLQDEGEVKIQFSDNQVLFSFDSSFIISRLIEGEFPEYSKVIPPKSEEVISLQRDDFLSAVKRVSILTDQESQAIKLSINKSKMTISKSTPYLGEAKEEIEIEYTGESGQEIGFNPKYLMDVLKSLKDENLKFEVNGHNKPGVIRIQDEYVYVVLPMQFTV